MRFLLSGSVTLFAAAFSAGQALAQCPTVTDINPKQVGQAQNPASTFAELRVNNGAGGPYNTLADGDTFVVDSAGASRVYEWDNNGSVQPGNVPVTGSLQLQSAAESLAAAINADPLGVCFATTVPLPPDNFYIPLWWRSETGGYGATNANPVDNGGGGGKNLIRQGNPFNYEGIHRTYFRITGTNLNAPGVTFKLVSTVDPSVVLPGTITHNPGDGLAVTVRAVMMHPKATFPDTAVTPPLGTYDLLVEKSGCPAVTLPGIINLARNWIDDPSFSMQWLATTNYCLWNAWNYTLSPLWKHNNPPGTAGVELDACRKGDTFFPLAPRAYPFPTAHNQANDIGDNEWGSIKYDDNGRHEFWQTVAVNFPGATLLNMSGIWAAGTETGTPITYGIEVHQGDKNGPILSQLSGQVTAGFTEWQDFSFSVPVPVGTTELTTVVFSSATEQGGAKGFHVDDLFLGHGAPWPDADRDGDVDLDDFGAWQRCYSGVGPVILGPGCAVFDRDADSDVDESDFNKFDACSTQSGVALEVGNLPVNCEL